MLSFAILLTRVTKLNPWYIIMISAVYQRPADVWPGSCVTTALLKACWWVTPLSPDYFIHTHMTKKIIIFYWVNYSSFCFA